MYRIIATDGKQYGPVSAEQIRRWIAENRVERQTPVFVDGAKDWNFLGLLPEFAALFAGNLPPTPPPIAPPRPLRKTNPFATAGMICGILSVTLICCCAGFPFNVLGLAFSIIALLQISENPQLHEGRGFAVTGLILSAASFLLFIILITSGHTHINFNTRGF